MLDFTGPTTVYITNGPTADDIRTIVAAELAAALTPLEESMTTVAEIIAAEDVKVSTLAEAFADFASDVRAYLVAHPPTGDVSAEDQAAAEALSAKTDGVIDALAQLDTEFGDQDGSDTPAPTEPTDGGEGTGEGDTPAGDETQA